jgi:hypothetical protein
MSAADSPFMLPAPGPHLDPALLRQYAAGSLTPNQQHLVEAHTLDCEQCADILDGLMMSDAATTDQAIAALRSRLQQRLPQPVPATPSWAWPRVAAAAALLGLTASGIWGWQHFQETTPEVARTAVVAPLATPAEPQPTPAPPVAAAPTASTPTEPTPAASSSATESASIALASAARPSQSQPMRSRPGRRPVLVAADAAPQADQTPAGDIAAASAGAPVVVAAEASPDFALATEDQKASASVPEPLAEVAVAAKSKKAAAADLPAARREAAAGHTTAAMPAAPQVAPTPIGGIIPLREYVRRTATEFDPTPYAGRLTGTVHVRALIGEDGKILQVKVVRHLRPDYDAEALRIVCEGPSWVPGITGGRRGPMPVEITVPF